MNTNRLGLQRIPRRIMLIPIPLVMGAVLMMYFSWSSQSSAKSSNVAINLAGRQRMLNQRHAKELLVVAMGETADLNETRRKLLDSVAVLLNGGESDFGTLSRAKNPVTRRLLKDQLAQLELAILEGDRFLAAPRDAVSRQRLLDATATTHVVANACVSAIQKDSAKASAQSFNWNMGTCIVTAIACWIAASVICRGIVLQISTAAESLQRLASRDLSDVVANMQRNSTETATKAAHANGAATSLSTSAQSLSTAVGEFKASIREISGNTSDAASIAQKAVEAANQTNATITKLGQSSTEIGNVIKVINSIAEQTNLLALNATIEAARAGEAGKGFAVVANEVKELSKQTGEATEDIISKIATIQDDTGQAFDAITSVGGVISSIHESQNAIASAVEQQSAMTGEISRHIDELANGSQSIVENIESLANIADSTSQVADASRSKASEIEATATQLLTLVDSVPA